MAAGCRRWPWPTGCCRPRRGARRCRRRPRRRGRRPGGRGRRRQRRPWCRARRWRGVEADVTRRWGASATGRGGGERRWRRTGQPDSGVGGEAGCEWRDRARGDGNVRVGEDPAGVGFAAGAGEGEEDPVGVSGLGGQAGVAVELLGEAGEAFGAVVVFEEEREAGLSFGPDAVAVGADDLAPLSGAAPLGPPLVERAAGPGAGRARAGGEEAVEPDEMGEALAGGEVVDEAAAPVRSATSSPASAATRAAPSGPRTQWKGAGSRLLGVGSGRASRGRTAPTAASGLGVPR